MTNGYETPADSGNLINRHFCPTCGAPVYSTNSGQPNTLFLRASSLDDFNVFKPQMVVSTKRGAAWDYLNPALPTFETQPSIEEVLSH